MTDATWRPLGMETEHAMAAYDALREGLPDGMRVQFWEWVQDSFTGSRRYPDGSGVYPVILSDVAEHAAQALSVPMGSVRRSGNRGRDLPHNLGACLVAMQKVENPLAVADFLLAHSPSANPHTLESMLKRSRSAWTVGERSGHAGLVRRMPKAIGQQMDEVVRTSGSAGAKLGEAWEAIYGLSPNPSHAYTLAIRAVEDAAIPLVVRNQDNATLGHVIGQMRGQGDWDLSFGRVPDSKPDGGIALAMLQALWFGQHDRHGGVPSGPGAVTQQEAEVAVSLALSLVHWFTSGMLARR